MRLIMIGFGVVGQGLARILRDQAAFLRETHGFDGQIIGVATRSRGVLYDPAGLQPSALLEAASQGHLDHYPQHEGLVRDWTIEQFIRESEADVLVEVSHSNLQTAQPALDYCKMAFASGKHVVLANKGPVALAMADLLAAARAAERRLLYEASVMAGTPALRLAEAGLAGCRVLSARGIINGTTNYILTCMAQGQPYAEALAQAQALGYAEADPTADVDGWDAAGKALILANMVFGVQLNLATMPVQGISGLTPADIEAAEAADESWKLIATVTPEGAEVAPVRLPKTHPLAGVSGATNAVTYTTDLLGDVTLIGPGAGQIVTAAGILADLLHLN